MEMLFNELIATQQQRLLKRARQLVPKITPEDLLQPQDYPTLEVDPLFRYEEGVLEGLLTARAALRPIRCEQLITGGARSCACDGARDA